VPASLQETLRLCWAPSAYICGTALLLMLPIRWVLPISLSGLIWLASISGITLLLAGWFFIARMDERAVLLSFTRRLIPRASR
jgi:hypothetical protein